MTSMCMYFNTKPTNNMANILTYIVRTLYANVRAISVATLCCWNKQELPTTCKQTSTQQQRSVDIYVYLFTTE